jgi:putative tryptophan/tyrosine transport system substrate-binding protein
VRRREFIAGLGGAAAWPLAARAQQRQRMRRIGILLPAAADDVQFQAWVGAFLQELALLGWTIGRNVRIDTRWATANATEIRRHAVELAGLAPDVILAPGGVTLAPLLQATRTVPIVFPIAAAWRGRSRASARGASVCSTCTRKAILRGNVASPRSLKRLRT